MKVKDVVKDCTVKFMCYRDKTLWYKVVGSEYTFEFPVPIDDVGNATFLDEDKAIYFMRYIRRHILTLEEGRSA